MTLQNFKRFVGFGAFGFDPLYPRIVLRSLAMAVGTASKGPVGSAEWAARHWPGEPAPHAWEHLAIAERRAS